MMPADTSRYDSCYSTGYRDALSGFEFARWKALEHFLSKVVTFQQPVTTVLDYGCGNGLYLPLWQMRFPNAALYFADISSVALQQLTAKYPAYESQCAVIANNQVAYPDQMFDLVVSVEVMEHVEDLDAFLREIRRLLKPNGYFIWTTPCANRGSIEHLYSWLFGKIEATAEGNRRWTWEDPMHLRRLRSAEAEQHLKQIGFRQVFFRFRAHFFSFVCMQLQNRKMLSAAITNKLMEFDYTFLRIFPNGASMIGCAQK